MPTAKQIWQGSGDDVRNAIRGSIEKWEKIAGGEGVDHGPNNCPLCKLFIDNNCVGCPIFTLTGGIYCDETPYREWYTYVEQEMDPPYRVFDKHSKEFARQEVAFLKQFLPENVFK